MGFSTMIGLLQRKNKIIISLRTNIFELGHFPMSLLKTLSYINHIKESFTKKY